MKTLILIALTLTTTLALAAEPKAKPEAKPEPKAAATPAAPKEMPFHAKVDSIDATSFTHKNKNGTVVKHTISDKTIIKQGAADAKFSDIKVGDTVDGLRTKTKTDGTEYAVEKITKFGPEK